MLEVVLSRVLRPEHRAIGLDLLADDHNIFLRKHGKDVARFSALGATFESVIHAADEILEWSRSGIEFCEVKNG